MYEPAAYCNFWKVTWKIKIVCWRCGLKSKQNHWTSDKYSQCVWQILKKLQTLHTTEWLMFKKVCTKFARTASSGFCIHSKQIRRRPNNVDKGSSLKISSIFVSAFSIPKKLCRVPRNAIGISIPKLLLEIILYMWGIGRNKGWTRRIIQWMKIRIASWLSVRWKLNRKCNSIIPPMNIKFRSPKWSLRILWTLSNMLTAKLLNSMESPQSTGFKMQCFLKNSIAIAIIPLFDFNSSANNFTPRAQQWCTVCRNGALGFQKYRFSQSNL